MQDKALTLQKKSSKTKLQKLKLKKHSKKHYFAILKRNKHKNCKKIQNFGLLQQENKKKVDVELLLRELKNRATTDLKAKL